MTNTTANERNRFGLGTELTRNLHTIYNYFVGMPKSKSSLAGGLWFDSWALDRLIPFALS